MAILNPRLLELIETLVAARLDWLAFELIEGVRAGRPPEEPKEALAAAREVIRGSAQPEARSEPEATSAGAKPILLDEQIHWAAAYVEERLGAALEQLQVSIDTLDFIVEGTIEKSDRAGAAAQPMGASEPKAVAVLLDLEGERMSGRNDVVDARESLSALATALTEWAGKSPDRATP